MARINTNLTMINDGGGYNVSGNDKRPVAKPLPSTTLGADTNITAPGLSMVDNVTGINTGTVYDQVVNDWHQPPAVTVPPADTPPATPPAQTPPAATPPAATPPATTPPAEQAPAEQVPTGGIAAGGVGNVAGAGGNGNLPTYTDYRKEIEAMYAKQQEAKLAALEQTYLAQMAAIDKQAATIPQYYYEAGRQVSGQNAREQQAMNERFAAMGLGTGAAGQAALAQSAVYQGNVAAIKQAEAQALAAIEADRSALAVQYQAAIREAILNNESEKAAALYQEMLRLDEGMVQTALAQVEIDFKNQARADEIAAQNRKTLEQQAATMAAIGDFSLYAQLGYTPEQIAALTAAWQAANTPKGGGGGGPVTTLTFARAKELADNGYIDADVAAALMKGGYSEDALNTLYGYVVPTQPTPTPTLSIEAQNIINQITAGNTDTAGKLVDYYAKSGRLTEEEAAYINSLV